MNNTQLIHDFQNNKQGKHVIIEGTQALKHAVRFGAEIEHIITCDISELNKLVDELAPDISPMISSKILEVDDGTFQKISPKNHRTRVVTLAKKQNYLLNDIDKSKPIIFLEDPKDLENIGAVIRVSAAADAGAVITDAQASVWHPAVVRGGAGLQYALPVLNSTLTEVINYFPNRKIISLDPEGEDITNENIENDCILIFGTERHGIKPETLKKSDKVVRLSMKPGVSSLNLATSVSATLYLIK